jgi:catechol 2,3-dioxygenase-like lactoylglutathione lyase family enzyme
MRAIGFNHVSISAKNLEESLRFYEETFGLERIPTYNFGFRTQYLRCGSQQLHIFELEDSVPVRQHFALDVDDFEAVYRAANARGVLDCETFYNCMHELPDGAVQMYLRDPAGHMIEVDWPDVTTLDRSAFPELKKLSDRVPQTGEALAATLYLDPPQGPSPVRLTGTAPRLQSGRN